MQQEVFDQRRAGEFGIQEHTAAVQRSIPGPGGRAGGQSRGKTDDKKYDSPCRRASRNSGRNLAAKNNVSLPPSGGGEDGPPTDQTLGWQAGQVLGGLGVGGLELRVQLEERSVALADRKVGALRLCQPIVGQTVVGGRGETSRVWIEQFHETKSPRFRPVRLVPDTMV